MKKLLSIAIVLMFGLTVRAESMNRQFTAVEQQTAEEPVVYGNLAFMGISLGETPANMVTKLKAKGFRLVTKDLQTGYYRVAGTYCGMKSKVDLLLNSPKKISGITVTSSAFYNNSRGKAQLKIVLEKLKAIYGEAMEEYGSYTIELQQGTVTVGMYDRDELNGDSGEYYIGISFSPKD